MVRTAAKRARPAVYRWVPYILVVAFETAMTPPFRLQRAQRTIRIARGMLYETAQACPDLRPELEAAIARALAAEQRSAKLLKERMN